MSIPKVIHYCWFGNNPLDEKSVKCIDSWKKQCLGYEIIEWNENNFDITCNKYVQQAYTAKKYAFVTDYVRLFVMHKFGGIYMDTDVEVIKSLDSFLSNRAFSGFESNGTIPTGIMASEAGFPLFEELLHYYDDRDFFKATGEIDTTTNVVIITNALLNKGLITNGQFQMVEDFALYPKEVFCPKDPVSGKIKIKKNTVAIHHFSGSWLDEDRKKERRQRERLISIFGTRLTDTIMGISVCMKQEGFGSYVKTRILKFVKRG